MELPITNETLCAVERLAIIREEELHLMFMSKDYDSVYADKFDTLRAARAKIYKEIGFDVES